MLQRYLSLGAVPQLRPDPINSEKIGTEIEVVIPIDIFWEIEEIIKNIRFARMYGNSTMRLWSQFSKLIYPCIVSDRDRFWYRKNNKFS